MPRSNATKKNSKFIESCSRHSQSSSTKLLPENGRYEEALPVIAGVDSNKETADCMIKLKDDDILIVAAMLRFFYTFDYDAGGNTADVMSPTVFNVKMYSIGDKYDVPALKMLARQKFEESAKACWDMDDFPHAIAEVYKSTPPTDRGLRDLARDISLKNIKPLLKKQVFNNVLNEVVGFASDLVRVQPIKPDEEKSITKLICPSCSGLWGIDSKRTGGHYCPHCGEHRSDWLRHAVR